MTDQEIQKTAELLRKLQPGFLPLPIFTALRRLTIMSAAEIVVLHYVNDKLHVLLTRREPDDPVWPNVLHIPGSIYIVGDDTQSRAREVLKKELPNTKFESDLEIVPEQIILNYPDKSISLNETIFRIWASDSTDGEFYDVDNLPDDFIATQKKLIEIAIEGIEKEEK